MRPFPLSDLSLGTPLHTRVLRNREIVTTQRQTDQPKSINTAHASSYQNNMHWPSCKVIEKKQNLNQISPKLGRFRSGGRKCKTTALAGNHVKNNSRSPRKAKSTTPIAASTQMQIVNQILPSFSIENSNSIAESYNSKQAKENLPFCNSHAHSLQPKELTNELPLLLMDTNLADENSNRQLNKQKDQILNHPFINEHQKDNFENLENLEYLMPTPELFLEYAQLPAKIRIVYPGHFTFPPELSLSLKYPHGFDINLFYLRQRTSSNKFLKDYPCQESSNKSYSEDQSSVSSFRTTVPTLKSKGTLPLEWGQHVTRSFMKACTYYFAQSQSFLSRISSKEHFFTKSVHTDIEMYEAFNDVILQINDGYNHPTYQAGVITNWFGGIFGTKQIILTTVSSNFRIKLSQCYKLSYSTIYQHTSDNSESAEELYLPGFAQHSRSVQQNLGLADTSKVFVGSIFFRGKKEVNDFMRILKKEVDNALHCRKSGIATTLDIQYIISNFRVLHAKVKDCIPTFNNQVVEDLETRKTTKSVDISGPFLPLNVCSLLKGIQILETHGILSDVVVYFSYNSAVSKALFDPSLIPSRSCLLWKHWQKFGFKLYKYSPTIFSRLRQLAPIFELGHAAKQKFLETLWLWRQEIDSKQPKLSCIEDYESTSAITWLCTTKTSAEHSPFDPAYRCKKFSLDEVEKSNSLLSLKSTRISLRFYASSLRHVKVESLPTTNSIQIDQLVSTVWERYVYNFGGRPSNDDLSPVLRPSWVGQIRLGSQQATVQDYSVYVLWLGESSSPSPEENQIRMILRMGMTTRPVELMRSDRFKSNVGEVLVALKIWSNDLQRQCRNYIGSGLPTIRIYGVLTSNNLDNEYIKMQIAQLLEVPEILKKDKSHLNVKSYIVTIGWLFDCYHRASIEHRNDSPFLINISEMSGMKLDSTADDENVSIFKIDPPMYCCQMQQLPLWGWIIFMHGIENDGNFQKAQDYAYQCLGIHLIHLPNLKKKELMSSMQMTLKQLEAPYKDLKHADDLKISTAIVSCNPYEIISDPFIQITLECKLVLLPGYEGIPIVRPSWLEETLKTGQLQSPSAYLVASKDSNSTMDAKSSYDISNLINFFKGLFSQISIKGGSCCATNNFPPPTCNQLRDEVRQESFQPIDSDDSGNENRNSENFMVRHHMELYKGDQKLFCKTAENIVVGAKKDYSFVPVSEKIIESHKDDSLHQKRSSNEDQYSNLSFTESPIVAVKSDHYYSESWIPTPNNESTSKLYLINTKSAELEKNGITTRSSAKNSKSTIASNEIITTIVSKRRGRPKSLELPKKKKVYKSKKNASIDCDTLVGCMNFSPSESANVILPAASPVISYTPNLSTETPIARRRRKKVPSSRIQK